SRIARALAALCRLAASGGLARPGAGVNPEADATVRCAAGPREPRDTERDALCKGVVMKFTKIDQKPNTTASDQKGNATKKSLSRKTGVEAGATVRACG